VLTEQHAVGNTWFEPEFEPECVCTFPAIKQDVALEQQTVTLEFWSSGPDRYSSA